ncbi:ATP-dependent Lhr-like helicase [Spinactinospora alkalitolerans]|uniref:ATP-dependent Lhr-like helicase n=1 Tax=Spinactinospora alkalitolerans TaxID=687207 RepID=A0A852TR36_9ACTN|nr:DEAD/DEAH box helicase [Spinactinospora alkalitolerans]NYE46021.1 ATP-dependent Lhr-like helicase [Spinactinospora alkalitolerans]
MTATGSLDLLHPTLAHHVVNTLGWPGLRPLQREALAPLVGGEDAVLLAPTAGGKTEAAAFPLLSAMAAGGWTGVSLLYVCPIKALLNNLLPRLQSYAGWMGRSVGLWHGDVGTAARRRLLRRRPDILLTTPESLEGMLVSTKVDHRDVFAGVRAIVVDEVHAFAGDDRGWHLLAVLERLTRICGRPVQRVGLSATVGNPDDLLTWLQGSGAGKRPGRVIAPGVSLPGANSPAEPPPGDVELDYVGSLDNAAKVVAALHAGEKRLVFCDSRQAVEHLGAALRVRGVTTFLSHASLAVDERRRAEQAFAEARDCVIVSTSTLELGIDVGDLDRVVQVNAPGTVASFLQRIGRTGRRSGTRRNCLFLALDEPGLLRAAALLRLWGRHWVEPVVPTPEPRHIIAQQLLALCLQESQVGEHLWPEWWDGLEPFEHGEPIVAHLLREGFVDRDGGMLMIGPEAERRFGWRHFMELTTVFTAPPEFTVLHGRTEIGRANPALLSSREQGEGPRRLLLAGRSWAVTWVDWKRQKCFVEPADDGGGKARWDSTDRAGSSFALTRAVREVLLGADPPVRLTRRAVKALGKARERHIEHVHADGSVVTRTSGDVRWWTWAGTRTNLTLRATLTGLVDPAQQAHDSYLRLREDVDPARWAAVREGAADRIALPEVSEKALEGLKFTAALPSHLAARTLAARLADVEGARRLLGEPTRFVVG